MRTLIFTLLGIALMVGTYVVFDSSTTRMPLFSVSSPNNHVTVDYGLDTIGQPFYQVHYDGQSVIKKSNLGFVLADGKEFHNRFTLIKNSKNHVDEVWENYWGRSQYIRNNYTEAVYTLHHPLGIMKVFFRVFDDGLGFRYELEKGQGQDIVITEEKTSFNLSSGSQSWWIPVDDDSYEKFYEQTTLDAIDSVQTPFTLRTPENIYVSIHEAALVDFPSMTLKKDERGILKSRLVPDPNGFVYKGENCVTSPWRTINFGHKAVDLINSDLIENLNTKSNQDFSWVKPLKYMGVWWEMHLGLKTWPAGDRHGATTKHAKEMIDFAAGHGIKGLLVEGWNVGWDQWKDFDYCKAYDDYNLEEVVQYARDSNVEIIMHNETAGYVDEYEHQIPKAFDYYQKLGVKYIKTGYVGPIKTGEPHHGQRMVNHYQFVLEEAAKRGICILGHEHIKPTGLSRTWPNLLAVESARGQEYNAPWAPENNPPNHNTILPFTRLLAGPMDYTPGLFDLTFERHGISDKRAYSTLAHQLALYVVYHSPAQMACDLPENYDNHPAFEFIQNVPVNWSKSLALDGEIGEYVVVARKDRQGDDWYLGGITNETGRNLTIDCSFLDSDKEYEVIVYKDGESANYLSAPNDYVIEKMKVNSKDKFKLKMAPGGGFAVEFKHVLGEAKSNRRVEMLNHPVEI
ncbi:glycoside hydrolase family 97 protein [Labilibacter sediminis]|nr:glycoside hydrolase family 97 protein [Labilibacter sediminis]